MQTEEDVTEQKTMTVQELLDSLPEEKREDMADFLYSRVPCRFMLRETDEEIPQLPNPTSAIRRSK